MSDEQHSAPSEWVLAFIDRIRPKGRVLDVACGHGRHLRLALDYGFHVTGLDRDLSGVAGLADWPQVELVQADLEAGEQFPLKGRTFDGVIVTNYLWRPVLADIVACVADDGILIYETFARGHEKFGRPTNKDFLLTRNELIKAVLPNMTIVAFEHGLLDGENPKVVQRIVAGGRQRGLTG